MTSICHSEAVTASILTLGGWELRQHAPLRCMCRGCEMHGKRVWYNYVSDTKEKHMWRWDPSDKMDYFFVTNSWGVSTAWLRQFTERLARQHVSFQSEAVVHEREAGRVGDLDRVPNRADLKLEKAWVAWRVVVRAYQHRLDLGGLNLALPTTGLLEEIWTWYPDFMYQERLRGLAENGITPSVVVIDGNAKLARRICGRDVAELMQCSPLGKYTATQCSEKPSFGRKCCSKHQIRDLGDAAGPPQSETIVCHRRRRVLESSASAEPYDVCLACVDEHGQPDRRLRQRWTAACNVTAGQLQDYWSKVGSGAYVPTASPEADLTAVSCKTHKEKTPGKATRRGGKRCGWLYACTPEGYILHLKEYVGSESLPQRYFFLAELVEKAPAIHVVRHDDACHLRRYTSKRKDDGPLAGRMAYPNLQYITDGLHDRNHVDPWCLANCSPKAECNKEYIEGHNSQACEQLFGRIGRHKFVVRAMNRLTGAFFLHEMAAVVNAEWLSKKQRERAVAARSPQGAPIAQYQ